MATALILPITNPEGGEGSWRIVVEEDFDQVLNKCYPMPPPQSALEHRENMTFTTTDGRRIALQPHLIQLFEENVDE